MTTYFDHVYSAAVSCALSQYDERFVFLLRCVLQASARYRHSEIHVHNIPGPPPVDCDVYLRFR